MAKAAPTDLMTTLSSMSAAEFIGTVKGAALFEGDFAWVFWVCLIGYCAGNCAAILNASPKIRFVHGLVLLTMNSYGGSTIAAIICGQPVPFVVNEKLIVGLVCTWVVAYTLPGLPKMIKGTPARHAHPRAARCAAQRHPPRRPPRRPPHHTPHHTRAAPAPHPHHTRTTGTSVGSLLISICFETLRCHVMMNCQAMAVGVLKAGWLSASLGSSVPIIGPIIAGAIGGCGGGFFPLDKGLKPLEAETAWRVTSGFYGAVWLTLLDPSLYGTAAAKYFPLLADWSWVRRCRVIRYF